MIFIVAGPGGVGKSTVVARLLQVRPDLRLSRSWTTRPRRSGEADDAYVFVDREQFMRRVEDGGFLEWTTFAGTGHLYGTPSLDEHGEPAEDGPTVLEIDLDGARQVKERHPDAVLVLLTAGSRDLESRLRGRGDDEESVSRRLRVGDDELDIGRRLADYVVANDDVDRSATRLAGIMDDRRSGQ
jgi:guanylate kinase